MGLGVLVSCGGHVAVSPRKCAAHNGQWVIDDVAYQSDFVIEQQVYAGHGATSSVFLKDILSQQKIKCIDVRQVKVTIKQTWKDVFASALPFMARYTFIVEGTLDRGRNKKKL